jgi:hypothetical protein
MKEDDDAHHFERPQHHRRFRGSGSDIFIPPHVTNLRYQIMQKRLSSLSIKRLSDSENPDAARRLMRLVGIDDAGRRLTE